MVSKGDPTLVYASSSGAITSDIVSIYPMYESVVVSTSTGDLFAWGRNNYGQLGDNSGVLRNTPVQVDMSVLNIGETILQVKCGNDFCVALTSNNMIVAWGENIKGL
jgi:alpha-tubulin suppressor-like RCC1 family protein